MKSFFITATDTGIGKTTITAAMAYALRSMGVNVGVMKPFATGMQQKTGYKSEDVAILANAAQTKDSEDLINPYFFPIPASPYAAASKLNVNIDVGLVMHRFEKIQTMHDVVLVEGIGGILTPILKNYCIADLIKDMDLDVIVVASSRIGTVNHTMLTLSSAEKFGLNVRGIIINNTDSSGYAVDALKNELTNLSGVEVLCAIPNLGENVIKDAAQFLKASDVLS